MGGPTQAAAAVINMFGEDALRASRTALSELAANFSDPASQGPVAYADQFLVDHPDYSQSQAKADAVTGGRRILRCAHWDITRSSPLNLYPTSRPPGFATE